MYTHTYAYTRIYMHVISQSIHVLFTFIDSTTTTTFSVSSAYAKYLADTDVSDLIFVSVTAYKEADSYSYKLSCREQIIKVYF